MTLITAASKARFVRTVQDPQAMLPKQIGEGGEICIFGSFVDGKPEGIYTFEDKSVLFKIPFTWLREMLADIGFGRHVGGGYLEGCRGLEGQPFFELFDISDWYDFVGPETSKKLAADFENSRDTVKQKIRTSFENAYCRPDWYQDMVDFLKLYDQLHAAFKIASDNGFVQFD